MEDLRDRVMRERVARLATNDPDGRPHLVPIVFALVGDTLYTAVDEKSKSAILTEAGVMRCEDQLGIDNLYDPGHIDILHHVNQGLRAHSLFHRGLTDALLGGAASAEGGHEAAVLAA